MERSVLPVTVDGATYPVVLAEGFAGLGVSLREVLPAGRCVLVSNEVVAPLHGDHARRDLEAAGWDVVVVNIADGEDHKHAETWLGLVNRLLDLQVDRNTPVLALGGGVTGDLVGFAAAATQRGLPFVQVPTTLLAMVDASVGGKTGINTRQGKNLLGAFWQPRLVYAPFASLRTLDAAELRCGLGEVVKHGMISGTDAFATCERLAPALLAREEAALAQVVWDSVSTKAKVVEADPRENGLRAILNLGHTVGHAVESAAGYGELRHGEAVALGLVAITRFSASRGWVEDATLPDRLEALLDALHLPVRCPIPLDDAALANAILFDKKRARATIRVAVPVALGRIELRPLPVEEIPELVRHLPR